MDLNEEIENQTLEKEIENNVELKLKDSFEIKNLKPITILNTSIEELKSIFKKLYEYTEYEISLVKLIDKRFFTDPASTKFHSSHKYGLFFHSVNVTILSINYLLQLRNNKTDKYINDLNEEQFDKYLKDLIIASLFHDYCKIGIYIDEELLTEKQIWKIEQECLRLKLNKDDYISKLGKSSGSEFIDLLVRNNIDDAKKIEKCYKFNDNFQIGHGEKSTIQLLKLGFDLNEHQIIAIRYHMMTMDVEWDLKNQRSLMLDFQNKVPMLKCLYLADLLSGLMYEII
jgi:hypothetical protein